MQIEPKFSDLLRQYMDMAGFHGAARLATRVNELFEIPGFIHRGTITNWLSGYVKSVRNWQQLVAVAVTLHCDVNQTNVLLKSVGLPTIWELWAQIEPGDQLFFEHLPDFCFPQLPVTEQIPLPGPLTSGSRIPLRPNPLFVGRDDELRQIAEVFAKGQFSTERTLILAGMGGVGKTQLAVEFAHRYGRYFPGGVFWLHFSQPETVPNEIILCRTIDDFDLQLDFNELSIQQQVTLVQRAWQKDVPRLLVFDECEDEALLAQWQPTTGGCSILVTSRRHSWDLTLAGTVLNVAPFTAEKSTHLLHHFVPDVEDTKLEKLAVELGHLPLAIHLAGNYLMKYKHAVTVDDYMNRLRDYSILEQLSANVPGVSPTKHELDVKRTFLISYEKLDTTSEVDQTALWLLARTAVFAPSEPIPRELLLAIWNKDHQNSLQFEEGLLRLYELGLIYKTTADTIWLHLLTAQFAQSMLPELTPLSDVGEALLSYMTNLNQTKDSHTLKSYEQHFRHVTDLWQGHTHTLAANLCHEFGIYLLMVGEYKRAYPYLERGLLIREALLGADDLDTASSLNELGVYAMEMGKYEDALQYFEKGLDIREKQLGTTHPLTASSLNYLGRSLIELNRYSEAEPFLLKSLQIRENGLNSHHVETADTLNNLGILYAYKGESQQASSYFEKVLAIKKETYGNNHPETATGYSNLGTLLRMTQQYAEAQVYFEKAYQIWESNLGSQHPNVAIVLCNLGPVYSGMEQPEKARACLEQALSIWEAVLGSQHLHVAMVFNNLGDLSQKDGDFEAALQYYERALNIKQNLFDQDHVSIAVTLVNIGDIFLRMDEIAKAVTYFEQAKRIYENILGFEHQKTTQIYAKLAQLAQYS